MKKYTESHEWIDEKGQVGLSSHALERLGDIVFVELPDEGESIEAKKACAVIESHKAASDIYAPVSGKVIARNAEAIDHPEGITADDDLWLFTITPDDPAERERLMDEAAYKKFLSS